MTSAQLTRILNGFDGPDVDGYLVKYWLQGGHTLEGASCAPDECGLVRLDPIKPDGYYDPDGGTQIDVSTIVAVSKLEV